MDSVSSIISRTEDRPINQTIAGRRASLNSIMLSRSAPDAFTLDKLAPLNRSTSRSSLPDSPCCNVATQTPTDAAMHFEFPDESFEFDLDVDSDDMLDGISLRGDGDSRQGSPPSAGTIWNIDRRDSGFSSPPTELSLWNRCLRRLSSHSDIVRGVGLHRRVSFTEQRTELKVEVQDVGLQLRSIGDDWEKNRSGFTRTRSLSYVGQKKR